MRLALRPVLLSLAILGCGCAETKLTGFRDPAFKGASYSDVVVMCRSGDLIHDQMAEDYFVRSLSGRKVGARPSTGFFPPTRETTQAEVITKLAEEKVEALLAVRLKARWADTGFDRGTSYTMPRATYAVELIDVKSGSVAWTASAASAGDELSGPKEMLSSLASKTTATLLAEGLLCPVGATARRGAGE